VANKSGEPSALGGWPDLVSVPGLYYRGNCVNINAKELDSIL
jgi:hypothetical protein